MHPDDIPSISRKIEDAFSGKELELMQYRYGEEYGSYIWMESLGQVIISSKSNRDEIVINCRDITERKKAEVKLKESELFLKETQNIAQIGTYSINMYTGKWTRTDLLNTILGIDADYDLNANNVDLITLGLAYGATGSTRAGASNNWTAQPSTDWSQSFQLGANYKHSDCNGDGVVDMNDTLAISLNYNNVHPFRFIPEYMPPHNYALPDFYLVANPDTAYPSQQVNVDFMLGTNLIPIDSIYAIAFRIYYDSVFIDKTTMSSSFASSWMGTIGTDMMSLTKNFYSQGEIDLALTKIEHTNNLGGFGKIGTLSFNCISNPTAAGIINFYLSDVVAVTTTKRVVSLNTNDASVVFNPLFLGTNNVIASDGISVYPNPAKNTITINSSLNGVSVFELYNSLGQKMTSAVSEKVITKMDVSYLPVGIYQLKIINAEKTIVKNVQIVK